jgi:hypothetical protein
MQRPTAPQHARFGASRARLIARASVRVSTGLLALATLDAVDHHVLRAAPVDAGARPLKRHPGKLPCCPRCCHKPGARTVQNPRLAAVWRARPRGFEPLTFGSVADKRSSRCVPLGPKPVVNRPSSVPAGSTEASTRWNTRPAGAQAGAQEGASVSAMDREPVPLRKAGTHPTLLSSTDAGRSHPARRAWRQPGSQTGR